MTTETATLTRVDLTQALIAWQPIEAKLDTPLKPVDALAVYVLTAELLEWPVTSAAIRAQSGRFAVVEYTPVLGFDPDIMICLESGPGAEQFRRAVRRFQETRRLPVRYDPRRWYQLARESARGLAGPLWGLNPTRGEAAFVIRWALQVVATGGQVSDGISAQELPDSLIIPPGDLAPWSGWVENA